ncbi:Protein preY, mitochondrial [Senna tora]|uniref:Protein preY, mitochondrial n=1 Tax=Senna tora TaxID=362788 RepID=A0A834TXE4_9FABA|nr:Protein preY, mitochondrial [Senna tora]
MVRMSKALLQKAGPLGKTLTEILVCPLSKQPLRYCEETNSLISDAIGVSFPIKNGIPSLVPTDGKILEEEDTSKPEDTANSSARYDENRGRNS